MSLNVIACDFGTMSCPQFHMHGRKPRICLYLVPVYGLDPFLCRPSRLSLMADYPDHDRRPYIQPHPPPYYRFASYTLTCTSASEFRRSNPLPTYNTSSASNRDIWQHESSTFPEYFNHQDLSILQNTFHPLETHYPSDHLQPQYEFRDSVPYLVHYPSAPLFGFTLPVPEATQQYQWANQTDSELGLAAWHEYWQPQGQEPDGRLVGNLPYLTGDDHLYVLDGNPESPTRSSSCQHVSDTAEPLTQNAHSLSNNSALVSRIVAAIPPAAGTTEQSSPHVQSTSRLQSHSPCSPHLHPKNHAQRVLAHQQRSQSPQITLRPPSRTSVRKARLPGTKLPLERKPRLACLFCRSRKIACGAPAPGSTDRTCK